MSDDSSSEATLSRDVSNVTVFSTTSHENEKSATENESENDGVTLNQSHYDSDEFLSDTENSSHNQDDNKENNDPQSKIIEHEEKEHTVENDKLDDDYSSGSDQQLHKEVTQISLSNSNNTISREDTTATLETRESVTRESTNLSSEDSGNLSTDIFSRENIDLSESRKLPLKDEIQENNGSNDHLVEILDQENIAREMSELSRTSGTTSLNEAENIGREKTGLSTTSNATSLCETENKIRITASSDDENITPSRESTVLDTSNESDEELKRLEKEDSVLIEKDGKFELVSPNDLKADYYDLLGLPEEKPRRKPSSAKVASKSKKVEVPNRPSHSSLSTSPYAHIQSSYAMSEQQKEMKKRRAALIKLRKEEEKERKKEEEEQKKKAAEKCFQVMLTSLILVFLGSELVKPTGKGIILFVFLLSLSFTISEKWMGPCLSKLK